MKDAAWESCSGPQQSPPQCLSEQPDCGNLTVSVSNLYGRCELRHAENQPQGEWVAAYVPQQAPGHRPKGTSWRLDLKDGAHW